MAAEEKANGLSLGIGIEYSWTVQQLSESGEVPDDTYFYDFTTKLVYYKNASGVTLEIFGESSGGADTNAIHDNEAGEIFGISSKTGLVDADMLIIEDSASVPVNSKRKITIGDIKEAVGSTGTPGVSQSVESFPISCGTIGNHALSNQTRTIKVIPTVKRVVNYMSYFVTSVNTANIKVGIYNSSFTLLGYGNNNTMPSSTGVQSIPLNQPVTLEADTVYYFALHERLNQVNFLAKSVIVTGVHALISTLSQGALGVNANLPSTMHISSASSIALWLKAY